MKKKKKIKKEGRKKRKEGNYEIKKRGKERK